MEAVIDAPADEVWSALSDWGGLHVRLVPGFVTDTTVEDGDRIVTFFDGTVVRERLVACDGARRRLVWSVVDGPYAHHNGAAQVFDEPDGSSRFSWTADLLPDAAAERTAEMMNAGMAAIERAFKRAEVA
jgi:hypothetical protein